jgi:hypothetical protein
MLQKQKVEMDKLKEDKGESVIPKGPYCYDENGTCPYLDYDDEKDEQESGYCWYLNEADWEVNETSIVKNVKTGEESTGHQLGIPIGLLWDQCKSCGINDVDEEEEGYGQQS